MGEFSAVKNDLDPRKFKSQLKAAGNATRQVFEELFGNHRPADRAVSAWLRENRQYGSRDRQFITETLYALLRYWGMLRRFLPQERREEIESGTIRIGRTELEALFFAALYLEGSDLDAADAIARQLELPWPKMPKDADIPLVARANALAELFGCKANFSLEQLVPEWTFDLLEPDFPRVEYLKTLTSRPPMWLRGQIPDFNHLAAELQNAGLRVRRHERIPNAIAAEGKVNLFMLDAFRRGEFEVQDLASQCIGIFAAPQPGERWFDACAGAGGKTLQLADRMGRTGTVVASDIRGYKLEDLRTRARRAGFPNIETREWDGKPFRGRHAAKFDGVLVDAPCSCSGVWRRNPDGRWILRPQEVTEIAELQLKILNAASTAVRPGGVLVYATCSLFPAENGEVVGRFLADHPDFSLEAFPHPLTGAPTDGTMRVLSFEGDCDSMFAARMRRSENTGKRR